MFADYAFDAHFDENYTKINVFIIAILKRFSVSTW